MDFTPEREISSFGHHFIVGIAGVSLSDAERDLLSTLKPAGILLLKRNFSDTSYPDWLWQLESLYKEIQQLIEREKFIISIDHEGKRVNRTLAPITAFPNACDWKRNSAAVGTAHGIELRSLGVNISWAPCADIHSNPNNPVIGVRSFGSDPTEVAKSVIEYSNALMAEGVLSCAKHFPGHGDTAVDSHLEMPLLDLDLAALRARELIPFAALVNSGVPLVMTSHILFPKLDSVPATLSKKIMTGILCEELGFNGVVVTDDLDMKAIYSKFGGDTAVPTALDAGVDLFLVARYADLSTERPLKMAESMMQAYRKGVLTYDNLYRSFCRISDLVDFKMLMHKPFALDEGTLGKHQALVGMIGK